MSEKILIIDNVRSAYNVGSMFRTADGAGVSRIILVGYSPAPLDRFGRIQSEIAKTSLGASAMIPWDSVASGESTSARIAALQQEGFTVVAVEQAPNALSLHEFSVPEKVAYIVGNEIDGVSSELLHVSDVTIHIPMRGQKESLNVGVAAGIVLFHT